MNIITSAPFASRFLVVRAKPGVVESTGVLLIMLVTMLLTSSVNVPIRMPLGTMATLRLISIPASSGGESVIIVMSPILDSVRTIWSPPSWAMRPSPI